MAPPGRDESAKPGGVLLVHAQPLDVSKGSSSALPSAAPLSLLESLDTSAASSANGVSIQLRNGVAVISAASGAATGSTTLTVTGTGCTSSECGRRFELTVPVTVTPIAAPPGSLEEMTEPSLDRIAGAVDHNLADELLITLGSTEAPRSRQDAEQAAASVGAVVAGGLESSGIYQIRWAEPQNLEAKIALLEGEPEVTAVAYSTVGFYSETSAYPVAAGFDQPKWTWPYEQVDALGAWSQTVGSGVKVGVIDGGNVYAGHEDLGTVESSQISVPALHATHVAGLACAKANSVGMVGLAQGCSLVSNAVAWAGYGDSAILDAMQEMAAWPGVRVVNVSIGYQPGGCVDQSTAERIEERVRQNKGVFEHFLAGHEGKRIVWTFSAGNNCAPGPASSFAANAQLPNVISVAATNSNDTLASFSDYGPGVEVAAPGGVNVGPLTKGLMSSAVEPGCSAYCSVYEEEAGTSMAAPIVAGIAALVRSAHPTFTADEAGACITSTAGTEGAGPTKGRSSLPSGWSGQIFYSGPTPIVDAAAAIKCIPRHTAISYAGSGGGDGWAVALTTTAVYNVFHHDSSLQIACHLQENAEPCWYPETETITDGEGSGFATPGQPALWLDHITGKIYVFATRVSDETAGVVCIDTTEAATNPDPFCGFTPLTGPSEASLESGISNVSDAVLVGSRWYAFNYVNGAEVEGAKNRLLCFDVNTLGPCSGEPFSVTSEAGVLQNGSFPVPAVAMFAGRVIVPLHFSGGEEELECFDGNTESACPGSWPTPTGTLYNSSYGTAFPLLSGSGSVTGFCLPTGEDPCFNLTGAPVSTPPGISDTFSGSAPWNGPALIRGTRIYVPNGNLNGVECFDYASAEACENYPKFFENLGYLYTVNADPERPHCIWVNADSGSGQIQTFDEKTGGVCE
ncbi:MAG TPA: S8 family serine peptidase [Solirubrobacterales bacterium]